MKGLKYLPGPFASFDIGTGAVRICISKVLANGKQNVLYFDTMRHDFATDLGKDGVLGQDGLVKLSDWINSKQQYLLDYNVRSCRFVSTQSFRSAVNRDEATQFLEKSTGFKIETITHEEEVKLSLLGNMDVFPSNIDAIYVDIGGGSSEMSLTSNKKVIKENGFMVGNAIIGDIFAEDATISSVLSIIKDWQKKIEDVLDEWGVKKPLPLILAGGPLFLLRYIKKLTLSDLAQLNGEVTSKKDIERALQSLLDLKPAGRKKHYYIDDKGVDMLPAAALITLAFIRALKVNEVILCGTGVARGVIFDMSKKAAVDLKK